MIISSEKKLPNLLAKIREKGIVAVDTETEGTEKYKSKLKKNALVLDRARLIVVPLYLGEFDEEGKPLAYTLMCRSIGDVKAIPPGPLFKFLREFLEDEEITKIFHNQNYDRNVFLNYGIETNNWRCTFIESFLVDENEPKGLKERAVFLGMNMRKTATVRFDDPQDLALYAEEDVIATWRLAEVHDSGEYEGMEENEDYITRDLSDFQFNLDARTKFHWKHYQRVEIPVANLTVRAERRGFRIDRDHLIGAYEKAKAQLEEIEGDFYEEAGQVINIRSLKDLRELFFDRLKYPVKKKAKTGPSLDKTVLPIYAGEGYTLAAKLQKYREVSQLINLYLNPDTGLVAFADEDGFIHSTRATTQAVTGRSAYSLPNLQQVPKRQDIFEIRKAFIAKEDDWVIIKADYSTFEIRLMATFSKDPVMLEVLSDPAGDLHQVTADAAGVKRNIAKAINFGLLYGMGHKKLGQDLTAQGNKTSDRQAKAYRDAYFGRYVALTPFRHALNAYHRSKGYVRNLCGRYRRVPGMDASSFTKRSSAERELINNIIQSSAADFIKYAEIRCDRDSVLKDLGVEFLIQVHDELVFQAPRKNAEEAAARICELMMMLPEPGTIVPCPIPFLVEADIHDSWGGDRPKPKRMKFRG